MNQLEDPAAAVVEAVAAMTSVFKTFSLICGQTDKPAVVAVFVDAAPKRLKAGVVAVLER
jgi:hypothetical protein